MWFCKDRVRVSGGGYKCPIEKESLLILAILDRKVAEISLPVCLKCGSDI